MMARKRDFDQFMYSLKPKCMRNCETRKQIRLIVHLNLQIRTIFGLYSNLWQLRDLSNETLAHMILDWQPTNSLRILRRRFHFGYEIWAKIQVDIPQGRLFLSLSLHLSLSFSVSLFVLSVSLSISLSLSLFLLFPLSLSPSLALTLSPLSITRPGYTLYCD